MKNAIKKYLEEECKEDKALAEVYDESKLDECISFIVDQVRRMSKGKNCAYDDATVFGWARHFFQDGPVNVDDVEPALFLGNAKSIKEEEKAVHVDVDLETIKKEAAEKAVAEYKVALKAMADEKKAAQKAKKEEEARKKAEAAENAIDHNQLDMFAEAV